MMMKGHKGERRPRKTGKKEVLQNNKGKRVKESWRSLRRMWRRKREKKIGNVI